MKKIVIIGAGFGGLSVVDRLYRSGLGPCITLIDKKKTSDFLPTLPDTIGRGIAARFLSYRIEEFALKRDIKFLNEEVLRLDLEKKEISTAAAGINYDYLVIASGSETNFYGNENIRTNAYKIDDVDDIERLLSALKEKESNTYIISGGGYTGVEVATNLRRFFDKEKKSKKIIILERGPSILGPLPGWMKAYVCANLNRLGVELVLNATIERIEGQTVSISGGVKYDLALVIWAAGVKTSKFIQDLNVQKNPQGRIIVDDYLRLNDNCFVIGDAANFAHKGSFLRMAVQFSILEGYSAAENIKRSLNAKPLKQYRPIDLGYIIPMANNRSCGNIMGCNLKGFLPTLFHFLMCIYRSWGFKNKLGIVKSLAKGGF